jgi:hypothetical protein
MDIISHGLYGGIAFGRKTKISYWKAFFFGVMPDLFSFGILFALSILSLSSGPDFHSGPPDPASIPSYVHHLYNITHSLVTVVVVFCLMWFIQGKPVIELLAWPLHILVDIPTHSSTFFPTPFLWPLSDFHVDGISWGNPYIFIPNVVFLAILYLWFYFSKRKSA